MGQGNPGFPALQADRTHPQPVPSWSQLPISHLPLLSQLRVGRRPNINQGGCVGVCSLNHKDRSVKILPQTSKKKGVLWKSWEIIIDLQFASAFILTRARIGCYRRTPMKQKPHIR